MAAKAVKQVNPKVMVLLETELWPAMLHHLRQQHTRILVVNGRMSAKSSRHYRLTRPLWSRIAPHEVLAVSKADADRFRRVFDQAKIAVMPNMKFETLESQASQPGEPETGSPHWTEIFSGDRPISVFASIRHREERQVVKMIRSLFDQYPKQVIALFPRHMHRIDVWKRRLKQSGVPFFCARHCPGHLLCRASFYGTASVKCGRCLPTPKRVFMGGSLKPLGGQNFLEPLLQGAPVVTGPFWDDFFWVGPRVFDTGLAVRKPDWRSAAHTMIMYLTKMKTVKRGDKTPVPM